jgi:hypothetical protein
MGQQIVSATLQLCIPGQERRASLSSLLTSARYTVVAQGVNRTPSGAKAIRYYRMALAKLHLENS